MLPPLFQHCSAVSKMSNPEQGKVMRHCWAVSSKYPWPPMLFPFPPAISEKILTSTCPTCNRLRPPISKEIWPLVKKSQHLLPAEWLWPVLACFQDNRTWNSFYTISCTYLFSGLLLCFHYSHGSDIASKPLMQGKVHVFSWILQTCLWRAVSTFLVRCGKW